MKVKENERRHGKGMTPMKRKEKEIKGKKRPPSKKSILMAVAVRRL